jgi:Zn-dependent protease
MLFNLIPIHPLDGGKIMSGFLPSKLAASYDLFMGRWGGYILLGLVFFGREVIAALVLPPLFALASLITGIRFG